MLKILCEVQKFFDAIMCGKCLGHAYQGRLTGERNLFQAVKITPIVFRQLDEQKKRVKVKIELIVGHA